MKYESYNKLTFQQHYEDRRYTIPFLAFKLLDFWPYMDFIAIYGQLVPNFIIVYLSINYNVSLYMGFNIACICFQYVYGILRLQARARKNF